MNRDKWTKLLGGVGTKKKSKFPFASYEPSKQQSHLADCGSFNIYEINHNPADSTISDATTMIFTIDHHIINSAMAKDMAPDQKEVIGNWLRLWSGP